MIAPSHRCIAFPRSAVGSVERLEDRIAPATLVGLTTSDQLVIFDSTGTGGGSPISVTGLQPGEHLLGIDFRPATGELFALGESRRLYTIDLESGTATAVNSAPFDLPLSGTSFGFDFNPVVDRIRVVSDANQNFRLNPNSGAVVDSDPNTPGTQPDPPLAYGMAADPTVTGSAYANNFTGAATTTLFGIDTELNNLVTQDPATGLLTTRGALGVDPAELTGFDILTESGGETAFAALTIGIQSGIYTIDLASGAATFVRNVPGTNALKGVAARGAGLTFVSDQVVTFSDVDGDLVRIKVSRGTLSASDFVVIPSGQGLQIRTINFSDDTIDAVNEFSGAALKVKSIARNQGDGLVNIGFINATGVDLGLVRVDGDLGQIDAGNATNPAPGLAGLNVKSLGGFGVSTQVPGTGSLVSTITGVLGPVVVRTNIDGAALHAVGADAAITSVRLGGSLLGSVPGNSGQIFSEGTIGVIRIGGDMQGGAGDGSGTVFAVKTLEKVVVEGSVRGGAGTDSGSVVGLLGLGVVRIGGDLVAGTGTGASAAGVILSSGDIERIIIGGDLVGGAAAYSGSIVNNRQGDAAPGAGAIGDITIAGSLIGGASPLTGIFSNASIGDVIIGQDLRGNSPATAKIQAAGNPTPLTVEDALAIASVTVGGAVKNARILAGYTPSGTATNADVQIGRVRAGGDWEGSDLVAGIQSADAFFGDDAGAADNNAVITMGNSATISSRIARIVIRGQVLGTPETGGDSFGFVAQEIGALVVNRQSFALSATTLDNFLVGSSGDVRLREYVSG